MTLLHSAGMAGLWMTLKHLEELYPTSAERPGNLTWLLTPRSISIDWEGQDLGVLDWLLKQSFQISDEGLIYLTGLNSQMMDIATQIVVHKGITGTFLQHNKFFKSAGKESKLLNIDGIKFAVEYKKAAFYAHQHFAKKLCDEHGQFLQEPIGVAGWLYPGAVVRHAAFDKQTKFEEKPEHALALLFTPVACQYFIMRSPLGRSASLSHTQPQQTQYALVIPKVTDLEIYAQRYRVLGKLGYKNYYVSSLGDAGLRFLTYETTIELARHNQVKQCQVILFGTVAWSEQQKTRTEIVIVEATEEVDFHYKLSCSCFHKCQVISYKNENFVIPSLAQGIIADNLAIGLPWWTNFYTKIKNNNLFKQIAYESQEIYNMIQNTEWNI